MTYVVGTIIIKNILAIWNYFTKENILIYEHKGKKYMFYNGNGLVDRVLGMRF